MSKTKPKSDGGSHYKAQKRHVSFHGRCTNCGGRLEMYDDMLGACGACKIDHSVVKTRDGYVVRPLVDHRHDDVVGHAV
jgi:hypothetical protein